jgi:hypothetical protein
MGRRGLHHSMNMSRKTEYVGELSDSVTCKMYYLLKGICNLFSLQHNYTMEGGRPARIQNDSEYEHMHSKLDEMRLLGYSWKRICEIENISTSWLLKWRKAIDYVDPIAKTDISDADLDNLVGDIQKDHPDRGETMAFSCVQHSGVHVPRQRIRDSIHRVNPGEVIYRQRAAIKRVVYSVKGPHHLWHVDGNHKMKDFGIAVEAGIDGFSRTCVFIAALTSYRAEVVLRHFVGGVREYTLPSRVRVDKGTENLRLAEYMVTHRGLGRGSILAGKSTRNQRIERFWRDVTKEVLMFYKLLFNCWVDVYGLDFNSMRTKFVIHHLFMDRINADLQRFRSVWNTHKLRTEHNQTPLQLIFQNRHLIKEAPEEIEEMEYGFDDEDIDIERHQMTYDDIVHPFNELELAYFQNQNPPFQLEDVDKEAMWQRTEDAGACYDYLVRSSGDRGSDDSSSDDG